MDMIPFAGFEQMDCKAFVGSDLHGCFLKECLDLRRDDLPPVFHGPYHMVVDVAHRCAVINKIFFHTHSISQKKKKRNNMLRKNGLYLGN